LVTLIDFAGLAQAVQAGTQLGVVFADIRNAVSSRVYRDLLARWEAAGLHKIDEPVPDVLSDIHSKNGHYMMDRLMMDAAREPPGVDVSSDDIAAILYTSGTTDKPKGVCLTHSNLVANVLQTRHWIPDVHYGQETMLSILPLTHCYGLTTGMNIPIALGATIVLLPVFQIRQVLEHIRDYKPTIFPGVPSMYVAINQAPDVRSYNLSSIKACMSGAAPLPVEVQEAFEKLTRGRLVEGYGLTEAGPVTHANPLVGVRKIGSIGIPLPNTDAKIVDLVTGEELPAGQLGELVVKGPQIMQGYWEEENDGDAESVLRDGWLYTGDVAMMDNDGYFQIISRKRDTILAGDYSVFPRDVEEVLYENNKVLEVAVVGVPSEQSGQRVKAFVVPRPGTSLSEQELLDLCHRRLDEYAVPWEIEFRDELPKSFIGKVLRRMLVESPK
jgi:long-chain acyl-CoA synthetase